MLDLNSPVEANLLRLKLALSAASIGLIYYGSYALYTYYSTPAISTAGSTSHEMTLIPAAGSLIGGLVMAFGCIFWWASTATRPRRRYAVPLDTPAPYAPSPNAGRTIAGMSSDVSSRTAPVEYNPNNGYRPIHGIVGAPRVDGGGQRPSSDSQNRRRGQALPPPFDPYEEGPSK